VPEELDFEERLAALARDLVNEPDMQHTVQRVVDAAAANLDGVVWASVSLVRQRREVETPASSDEWALRADQLQYELEQGSCLGAIWEQETFQIDDMTADEHDPRWSRAVAEQTGVRSSLSLQLFTDEEQNSLGALNLYSPELQAFDAARPSPSPRRLRSRCAAPGPRSTCGRRWPLAR
jgi:GAF domain